MIFLERNSPLSMSRQLQESCTLKRRLKSRGRRLVDAPSFPSFICDRDSHFGVLAPTSKRVATTSIDGALTDARGVVWLGMVWDCLGQFHAKVWARTLRVVLEGIVPRSFNPKHVHIDIRNFFYKFEPQTTHKTRKDIVEHTSTPKC